VIEAAMMACNMAPGLKRDYYGFTGWLGHDEAQWTKVFSDAQAAVRPASCDIRGADKDNHAITLATENAINAGVQDSVRFIQADVLTDTFEVNVANGLVLTNPPYGERLEIDNSFYHNLGSALSANYGGWHIGLFTAKTAPMRQTRLPLKPTLPVRNGPIECALYEGTIPRTSATASAAVGASARSTSERAEPAQSELNVQSTSGEQNKATEPHSKWSHTVEARLNEVNAQPVANRLKKNLKRLKSWLKREQIAAWRVYDADLPEFAVAIDIYDCAERHVVVQEYLAPATVNTAMASARLKALLQVVPECLEVHPDRVHLKVREKQQGRAQYEKHAVSRVTGLVQELGYTLECNFSEYLDTGLFLDHRPVRRYIQESASGKRFLNLFSYTGSATVAAATGGAVKTVSVDSSNRYSQWLTRNLRLNQLDEVQNEVVRSDVGLWLEANRAKKFDLILLDPPTFSNSTGIDADWNVQRDHMACIRACMDILEPGGKLVFSNNYRRFKLDPSLGNVTVTGKNDKKSDQAKSARAESESFGPNTDNSSTRDTAINAAAGTNKQYKIENRSHWSIDQDFQRNSRIHQCWFFSHK